MSESAGRSDTNEDVDSTRLRRWRRPLLRIGAILIILSVAAYLGDLRIFVAFNDPSCPRGTVERPVGPFSISECRPTDGSEERPRVAVGPEREFGIYLARAGVRLIEVDLEAGTVHGPALNVPPR